jgi:hypothetical protein
MKHCSTFSEKRFHTETRVARWYVFEPKIPIWVNLAGSWNGKCWRILWSFGIFYVHLVYFMSIGIFYGRLVI